MHVCVYKCVGVFCKDYLCLTNGFAWRYRKNNLWLWNFAVPPIRLFVFVLNIVCLWSVTSCWRQCTIGAGGKANIESSLILLIVRRSLVVNQAEPWRLFAGGLGLKT